MLTCMLPLFASFKEQVDELKCAWKWKSLSCVWPFAAPWTIACHTPLFMGFSRQEYWSVLPCPPPGDLPNPGIEPTSLVSPALAGGLFTTSATWEAHAKGASHNIAPVTPETVPPSVSPSVCPRTGGLHPNHRNSCLLRKSHKPPLTPALSQDREPQTQRKLSRSFSILGPMRSWANSHGCNELSPSVQGA